MHASQIFANARDMKKISSKRPKVSANTARVAAAQRKSAPAGAGLRDHYDFDYPSSRPNRFAAQVAGDIVAVVLDPDVAAVFRSSDAVNTFLRSAISAMPKQEGSKKRRVS
jgi:hypothetical protein